MFIAEEPRPLPAWPRRACVVDARLALSRHGMATVVRLGAEFDVWLPRELRHVLRGARAYEDRAEQLVPRASGAAERRIDAGAEAAAAREELGLWDLGLRDPSLAAVRLYHLGDRADECVVPCGTDRSARERCEQLQAGLDALATGSGYDRERGGAAADCVRDAAALCAALQPQGAFVLTRLEPDGVGAPALCDYLAAWGIAVREVPRRGGACEAPLRHGLARAGLGALAWCGVDLVAVHVALPGYPALGALDRGDARAAVARAWTRSEAFWHRIWRERCPR